MMDTPGETPGQEFKPPSVGQLLKAARIARGLTLEAVSKNLCISQRQLISFEEDAVDLVWDVYTLGFLKSYAEYLGLDKDAISQKFKSQTVSSKPSAFTFSAPLPGRGIPSFRILAFSLLALLMIIIGWEWIEYYRVAPYVPKEMVFVEVLPEASVKSEEPLLSHQEIVIPLQQTPFPASPILEAEEPLEEPDSSQTVFLKTTEEAWIEVIDEKGNIIISRLFRPGDSYEFKTPQNLILRTGNVGGTHLSSGQRILTLVGKSGEVKGDIPLNPEKWLEKRSDTD
jgi:cytoskeleton protein RodZ